MSPWLWNETSQPDLLSKIYIVVSYLLFYTLGYIVPYFVIKFFVFILFFQNDRVPKEFNSSLGSISFTLFITFLIFLQTIVVFFNNLPTDVWNGWLMILWFFLVVPLMVIGIKGFKDKILKYSGKESI